MSAHSGIQHGAWPFVLTSVVLLSSSLLADTFYLDNSYGYDLAYTINPAWFPDADGHPFTFQVLKPDGSAYGAGETAPITASPTSGTVQNNRIGPIDFVTNVAGTCRIRLILPNHIEGGGPLTETGTVHVCEVSLSRSTGGTTPNPDIWPKICTNAQEVYKTAKYTTTVKGGTTTGATLTVNSPHMLTAGSDPRTITVNDGDVITVMGLGTTAYTLTLTHPNTESTGNSIQATATGEVFKFQRDTATFVGGADSGTQRNSSTGTDKSNILKVELPDPTTTPVTTTYNPLRTFTATLKIKTVGTSSYTRGVTADVAVDVFEQGEIHAAGILGFDLGGNPIAIATASLTVQTKTTISGAAGGVVPQQVYAPQYLIKLMDSKVLGNLLSTSRGDVSFTGSAFPKTIDVVVESSGAGTVSYVVVPLVGPVHGLAFTQNGVPAAPYKTSWNTAQPGFSDYKIVP